MILYIDNKLNNNRYLINNKKRMKFVKYLANLCMVFALEDDPAPTPATIMLDEPCGNATHMCDFKTNLACAGPLVETNGD